MALLWPSFSLCNIALLLAYDGTRFAGFQRQVEDRTVQGELEAAIGRITCRSPEELKLKGAGRTDAGVHAWGQVVNFDAPPIRVDWVKALNSLLPGDIAVQKAKKVPPDFHSRYSAIGRSYRYRVLVRETPDPFIRHTSTWINRPLDIPLMREAWRQLVGRYDYGAFCSTGSTPRSTICTVTAADLTEEGNLLDFTISAQSFLYHMVRRLVGSVLEVGAGKRSPESFLALLSGEGKTGATAPSEGLTLMDVTYPPPFGWDE